MRSGRVLPEHVDLGLRLTVGEGILKKPFLQSTHGEGHFPEMSAQTEPSPNAYFPGGYPGTLCSTVWKFDKFTATQILREINFGELLEVPNLSFLQF